MREQTLYAYIWLGTCVRYLIDAPRGAMVHDFAEPSPARGGVLFNLEELGRLLDRHNLPVTKTHFEIHGLAHLAAGLRDEVVASDQEIGTLDLTVEQADELTTLAASLRQTLDAEASSAVAWVATDRRHPAATLLGDMSTLLASGAYDDLPDVGKYDVDEAGRAIAFDLPTAAGFHLMRATEAALRAYYLRLVKRDRLANPMWGPMVTALRDKKRNPPPGHLLDHLDTIRRNFRNPTQHPEKVYDLEEAQDLLSLSADAMSRMYRDATERGLT